MLEVSAKLMPEDKPGLPEGQSLALPYPRPLYPQLTTLQHGVSDIEEVSHIWQRTAPFLAGWPWVSSPSQTPQLQGAGLSSKSPSPPKLERATIAAGAVRLQCFATMARN